MTIRTRLLKSHRQTCFATNRDYPWCLLGSEFRGRGGRYTANKNGSGSGWHSWIKAICLDPKCDAEIAFHEDDVFISILGLHTLKPKEKTK